MRDNHANTYTLKPKQITRKNITDNLAAFNFRSLDDVAEYEKMLKKGFETISEALAAMDQVFVDTKFEFGYVVDSEGKEKLIYMDEAKRDGGGKLKGGLPTAAAQAFPGR